MILILLGLIRPIVSTYIFWLLTWLSLSIIIAIRIFFEHRSLILHESHNFGLWRQLSLSESKDLEILIMSENTPRSTNHDNNDSANLNLPTLPSPLNATTGQNNQSNNFNTTTTTTTTTTNNTSNTTTIQTKSSSSLTSHVYLYREAELYTYFQDEIVAIPLFSINNNSPSGSPRVLQTPLPAPAPGAQNGFFDYGRFSYYQLLSSAAAPSKPPFDNIHTWNGRLLLLLASSEGYSALSDSPLLHILIIMLVRSM